MKDVLHSIWADCGYPSAKELLGHFGALLALIGFGYVMLIASIAFGG